MMLSSIPFSWIIIQIFKVEPEQGQSDSSGSSQIPRLQPAPKPCFFGTLETSQILYPIFLSKKPEREYQTQEVLLAFNSVP